MGRREIRMALTCWCAKDFKNGAGEATALGVKPPPPTTFVLRKHPPPARMKQLFAAFVTSITASAFSQSIPNPAFETDCVFDLSGWDQFCTTPDAFSTDGHASCSALLLPASVQQDPCFANNEAIGVHTLLSGFLPNVPYALSLWTRMSDVDLTSDVGIFGVLAGTAPYFTTGYYFQSWPVGLGDPPGQWMQQNMNFTLPPITAGLDLYFFIEYSIAPDLLPGTKAFDDISFTDLSTGINSGTNLAEGAWPNPATDQLLVRLPEAPTALWAVDATGRTVPLNDFHSASNTLHVNVAGLSPGVYVLRWTSAQGIQGVRFIKN